MNWEQLKAIFWLRWQLTRNQWGRSKYGIRAVVAVAILVAGGLLGIVCFFAGLIGAKFGLRQAPSHAVMLTWFVLVGMFLMFWTLGLLAELQRSEAIDLQRLMHLPVKLGQIFIVNYLASHFALSLVIAIPAIFGLSLGLAIFRAPLMLLMLPLSLSMIFLVTAWTYCLRGWLAALMTNPRRRRAIVAGLTFAFVLIAQLPNLYLNVFNHSPTRRHANLPFRPMLAMQKFLPPFWVSLSAKPLAEGNPTTALLSTASLVALGSAGLLRAYRSTLKFYHGEASAVAKVEAVPATQESLRRPTTPPSRRTAIDRKLPCISNEASAVALASFRSMLRAPEIKMAWAMSIVVPLLLAATIIFRARLRFPEVLKPFLVPSVIAFSLLTLVQFLSNQFGFDRDGFQTFVLSPTRRSAILLGKNLAAAPVILFAGLLWLVLACIFVRLALTTALAAVFQIISMGLLATLFGNLISIYLPYRIRAASLKPTKISGARGLLVVCCQLFSPFLLIPVLIGPMAELFLQLSGNAPAFPINLSISIVVAAIAFAIYKWSLRSLGHQLQLRELKVLEVLATEVE